MAARRNLLDKLKQPKRAKSPKELKQKTVSRKTLTVYDKLKASKRDKVNHSKLLSKNKIPVSIFASKLHKKSTQESKNRIDIVEPIQTEAMVDANPDPLVKSVKVINTKHKAENIQKIKLKSTKKATRSSLREKIDTAKTTIGYTLGNTNKLFTSKKNPKNQTSEYNKPTQENSTKSLRKLLVRKSKPSKPKSKNKTLEKLLTTRTKPLTYTLLILTLILANTRVIQANLPALKQFPKDLKYLKEYNPTIENLTIERDQKKQTLDNLIVEYNKKTAEEVTNFLSKVRIDKPSIVTELSLLATKHKMDYLKVSFINNLTNGITEDPNLRPPEVPTEPQPPIEPGTSKTEGEIKTEEEKKKENSLSSTTVDKSISSKSLFSFYKNKDLLNYNSEIKGTDENTQTNQSTSTQVKPTDQSTDQSITSPVNSSKTIYTEEEIDAYTEKVKLEYQKQIQSSNEGTYLTEKILLIGSSESLNAFSLLQSIYQNKKMKFNIEYVSINKDTNFIGEEHSMYNYKAKERTSSSLIGIVLTVSSEQNAPQSTFKNMEEPIEIGDIFR